MLSSAVDITRIRIDQSMSKSSYDITAVGFSEMLTNSVEVVDL